MFGEDLSDANLLRRVRRGDERAFDVLVRRHDRGLRRLAARLLAEPDQVDDVILRAYAKAWRTAGMARAGGPRGGTVANWLYRCVYNACVDELRRQPEKPPPGPPTGPRVRLPKAPVGRREEALRALAPSERIPLVLVDGEGFTVEAAARILQRKPGQVAADLDAARRRWRDMVIGPPDPARQTPADPETGPAGDGGETAEDEGETAAGSPDETPVPANGDGPSEEGPPEEGHDGASTNGDGHADPDRPPAPVAKRSPEIDDPDDVTYAAEGAFDAERFSSLKRWFRSKGSSGTSGAASRSEG